MDALFIIPTLISPNIENTKFIPAIAKVVERNTLLANSGAIKLAVLNKYTGFTKTVRSETTTTKTKYDKENKLQGYEVTSSTDPVFDPTAAVVNATQKTIENLPKRSVSSRDEETLKTNVNTSQVDTIEHPKGISFFHMVGLEPTYMTIPIGMKSSMLGGDSVRTITIGIKSVPYTITNVDNIINLMKDIKSMSVIKRFFFSKWNSIKGKIPFTKWNKLFRGEKTGGSNDIIFSPNSQYLGNPKKLLKMMSVRDSTAWSTMTVLSNTDFESEDLKNTLRDYKLLVKGGWGDLVVLNEDTEKIHFCTQRMKACYTLPFAYLKNAMNLTNILDYDDISRSSKPWSVSTIRRALTDSKDFDIETTDTQERILEIIGG